MIGLGWVRMAMAAAVLLALAAWGVAVRAHLVGIGEARVQARWDAQKTIDLAETLRLAQERAADGVIKFRNAERIAHEQDQREASRLRRIAAADAVAERLRRDIDALNQRDLSAAGGDARATALAEQAAAARELLGSCAGRYRGVAAEADQLRDQVSGLLAHVTEVCTPSKSTEKTKGNAP